MVRDQTMTVKKIHPKDITDQVDIKIFVTPGCPHCKKVKKIALGFSVENPLIQTTVIDITREPEMQKKYKVLAAPKIVINEDIGLTGDISKEELLGWISKAGTPHGRFAKMLIQGGAEVVARMALKDQRIPVIMADMVVDADLGLRIGAMTTLIEIWEIDPSVLGDALQRIAGHLKDDEARDRGDAAYILGEIGDETVIGELETLTHDPDQGVREAAQEAVETIQGRKQ